MALSGMRYQNSPWLGCRHEPHTPSISFSFTNACGSYAPSLTSSHVPRKSICDGSSNRCPACITAPRVPACCPSITQASNLRPVGVSSRSRRGARSRSFASIRVVYRSGGSTMCESAEMSLCVIIATPPPPSGRKAVVRRAVVPQDLALALLGDRQAEERLHRPRELRVAVRKIRREDDPIVTDGVDDVLHRLLVTLHRHEALPLEIRAGRHRQLARVDVAQPFPVLIHAPEQEGHPATVALEEGHAQPRMLF